MSAPVKYTCPDIDKIIKYIRSAEKEASLGIKMDAEAIDDITATFKQIADDLDGVESMLEELRSSNSSLRDWGSDTEEQLEAQEKELDIKIEENSTLQWQLTESEAKIKKLEEQLQHYREFIHTI